MQDNTINRALLVLRRQTIAEGLDYVEALLALRGGAMPPIRTMPPDRAKRMQMTRLILDALQNGPQLIGGIAAHVARNRPELSHKAAYRRTCCVVYRMKRKGLVGRDGRVWWLVESGL